MRHRRVSRRQSRNAEQWAIGVRFSSNDRKNCPQKFTFCTQPIFDSLFSMKMKEYEKIVVVSCIIDSDDVQVWLRLLSLSLDAYNVMMVFSKIWPENIKKVLEPKMHHGVRTSNPELRAWSLSLLRLKVPNGFCWIHSGISNRLSWSQMILSTMNPARDNMQIKRQAI